MNKKIVYTMLLILLSILTATALTSMQMVNAKEDVQGKDWNNADTVVQEFEKLSNAGDKAEKLFNQLPPEGQKAIVDAIKKHSSVKVTVAESPLSKFNPSYYLTNSRTATVTVTGYYYWWRAWTYSQTITWNYDNYKIIGTPVRIIQPQTLFYLTFFKGTISDQQWGGAGQTYYRSRIVGQFETCITTYGCIAQYNPWIDMTVYKNGDYIHNQGGGG